MTTLALLKAEIADDLERNDLDTQIASEISKAIQHYQNTRFYFNETRDVTFDTVAAQKLYTSADESEIPNFIEIDELRLEDGTSTYDMDQIQPREWEAGTASGVSQSRPFEWCYFNRSIGLYPIPDDAYTVRMIGHLIKAAPATDDETGNVWMTEAFDLLRARVCRQLALKKIRDAEMFAAHRTAEMEELTRLKGETASRVGTGYIIPTEF